MTPAIDKSLHRRRRALVAPALQLLSHRWLFGCFLTLLCGGWLSSAHAQISQTGTPAGETPDAALTAALTMPRPISAGDSLWLEELTWMEVRDAIADGVSTIIVPTGGIEDNGPYLATGKHNVILRASCPAIAQRLGNALCAPIVKFVPEGSIDPPTGHMLFPGTISLSQSTFEALLTDIASSLRQSGFTHIVMIGDSGGNQSGMQAVAERLNQRWSETPARVHFIRDFYDPGWEATEAFTRRELDVRQTQRDGYHDDIWVTAMMMASDPEQVRYRQRVDARLATINGVDITPAEKTAAWGQRMIEFRAGLTADAIRQSIDTTAQ